MDPAPDSVRELVCFVPTLPREAYAVEGEWDEGLAIRDLEACYRLFGQIKGKYDHDASVDQLRERLLAANRQVLTPEQKRVCEFHQRYSDLRDALVDTLRDDERQRYWREYEETKEEAASVKSEEEEQPLKPLYATAGSRIKTEDWDQPLKPIFATAGPRVQGKESTKKAGSNLGKLRPITLTRPGPNSLSGSKRMKTTK